MELLNNAQTRAMIIGLYAMQRDTARSAVRSMLIFPGIRESDLKAKATQNKEAPAQLLEKRNRMLDATLDFIEEYLNLDQD